ncbi:anaerobic sulfite reductase subunit AsrA [Clostridium botulinum]|uniref:anaerobic sulfite reductase subunit AsrA n=1 Tax=Clostridium botulinum TaxID=1491 RepID=UPI00052CCFD9|nr:anaerobic sulfite reductase subunit AsrA [Clostridium botulinum]KGM97787.1 sulfite reductase subunit A [Clostridium botulinum D str. CCUG 7971]NFO98754.1 anaerobic sulfite reductase subunit AsrA [Clostridium botulinum]OOV51289.1 anaerobic sulfite reductase subunit A [Clostridium botulinum D/C]OOV53350.1 anaerobic sulfite reductase subunit A [Clostridium botulinum D/C]OOV55850.1 anaerobic sulfite reductase subunit A [Clostridium botulinum D/C]
MGIKLSRESFHECINKLKLNYKIYAPVNIKGKGRFSDTDIVRYSEVNSINEIEFDKKSKFSPKEIINPITQTLFYFTEDSYIEPKIDEKGALVFLRSCDIHGIKRLDEIYLKNGEEDSYYKKLREKVKFVLIGCKESFDNCFCVSMGSNKTDEYDMYLRVINEEVFIDIRDNELKELFIGKKIDINVEYVTENKIKVNIPEDLNQKIFKSNMWDEYSTRCIACGRCNFVCPTCTCFTMQDIFYRDNRKNGERRRIWASCHVERFTNMAGGHGFRQDKGSRMRFKVMHKVYDFKKRFGYNMCVGCGRCDDICPEYISFPNCINKLQKSMEGVQE